MNPNVERYINSIRNQLKRAYARAYARELEGGKEAKRSGLSYMAAQAVRMQIKALVNGRPK